MKKKLCFVLLLLLNAPTAYGQVGQYIDFPYWIGFDFLETRVAESKEELCNDIFNSVAARIREAGNDRVRLFGQHVRESSPFNFDCFWTSEDTLTGNSFQQGANMGGVCRNPLVPATHPTPPNANGQCFCPLNYVFDDSKSFCKFVEPDEDKGCNRENFTTNPCNIATGNKFRSETDIANGSLSFTRYYNSIGLNSNTGLGLQWTHNYQRRMIVDFGITSFNTRSVIFQLNSGASEAFTRVDANSEWQAEGDSDYLLQQVGANYILTFPNGAQEVYSVLGQIMSRTDTNGQQTTYKYQRLVGVSFEYLMSVTNEYGQQLQFEYEPVPGFNREPHHRINKITDAFGAVYQYQYDENRNLTTVIYPDLTEDDSDNPRKIYHYENQDYPNHLTGITDENGERYGNFAYDDDGKAILSELGITTNVVGQEKIELDFQ